MSERHYTPRQAAELFGCAERTWRALADEYGAVKLGRKWLIPDSLIRRILDDHRKQPTPRARRRALMKKLER